MEISQQQRTPVNEQNMDDHIRGELGSLECTETIKYNQEPENNSGGESPGSWGQPWGENSPNPDNGDIIDDLLDEYVQQNNTGQTNILSSTDSGTNEIPIEMDNNKNMDQPDGTPRQDL